MPDAGPVSMEVFHVHPRLSHSLSYTHTLTHTNTHMPIVYVLCLHCEDCFTKLLCLHIRPHIFPLDPWHKFMLFSRLSSKKLRATAISLWTNSQIYPLFLTTTLQNLSHRPLLQPPTYSSCFVLTSGQCALHTGTRGSSSLERCL